MFKFLKRLFRSSTRAGPGAASERRANIHTKHAAEDQPGETQVSEEERLTTIGTQMRYL